MMHSCSKSLTSAKGGKPLLLENRTIPTHFDITRLHISRNVALIERSPRKEFINWQSDLIAWTSGRSNYRITQFDSGLQGVELREIYFIWFTRNTPRETPVISSYRCLVKFLPARSSVPDRIFREPLDIAGQPWSTKLTSANIFPQPYVYNDARIDRWLPWPFDVLHYVVRTSWRGAKKPCRVGSRRSKIKSLRAIGFVLVKNKHTSRSVLARVYRSYAFTIVWSSKYWPSWINFARFKSGERRGTAQGYAVGANFAPVILLSVQQKKSGRSYRMPKLQRPRKKFWQYENVVRFPIELSVFHKCGISRHPSNGRNSFVKYYLVFHFLSEIGWMLAARLHPFPFT